MRIQNIAERFVPEYKYVRLLWCWRIVALVFPPRRIILCGNFNLGQEEYPPEVSIVTLN